MEIKSNNHWRNFLFRYEIPERILTDQFSHLGTDTGDGFLRYKGWYYHISDFERTWSMDLDNRLFPYPWDGYSPDSVWTGVVVSLSRDGEQYKIGTYHCGDNYEA